MMILYRINRKIKSRKAETLVETLVSVLTISISSIALAAMIGTASRVNKTAKAYDEKLDSAIKAMLSTGTESGTVTVKNATFPVKVRISGNDLELYSYEIEPNAGNTQTT